MSSTISHKQKPTTKLIKLNIDFANTNATQKPNNLNVVIIANKNSKF